MSDTTSSFVTDEPGLIDKVWNLVDEKMTHTPALLSRRASQRATQQAQEEEAAQRQALAQQREREQREQDVIEYARLLEATIFAEAQGDSHTVGVIQGGGGVGKTTLASLIASTYANASRRSTAIIDYNHTMGNVAGHLDVTPGTTLSVKQAYAVIKEACTPSNPQSLTGIAFSDKLYSTKSGVQVIVADKNLERNERYTPEQIDAVTTFVEENVASLTVFDTGNDVTSSFNNEFLAKSSAVLCPTDTRPYSMERAQATLNNNRQEGFVRLTTNTITVVSGVVRGKAGRNFRKEMQLADNQLMFFIPYDDYIGESCRPLDSSKVALHTRIACMEVTLAAIRVAKHLAKHKDEEKEVDLEPLPLKQGQMVRLSSGRTPILSYDEYLDEDRVRDAHPVVGGVIQVAQ